VWKRLTWEQFARATKFLAGITWGTLELWLWGARPGSLAFIGAVIGVTAAGQLYLRIRSVERSSPTENSSQPSPSPPERSWLG
jgi:hypothetical protein